MTNENKRKKVVECMGTSLERASTQTTTIINELFDSVTPMQAIATIVMLEQNLSMLKEATIKDTVDTSLYRLYTEFVKEHVVGTTKVKTVKK